MLDGGRVALKPRVAASASGQCLGDTVGGQHPGRHRSSRPAIVEI